MIFIFKTHIYHIPIRLSIRAGWKTLTQEQKNTRALSQVIFVRFVLFSVLFLAETLCFIFQVLYLILSQAKFQLSLLVKYSILNIFMPPLLSLGSKGHITLKWSGHSLKSLSQVKYSILNILSLWSKGHITLKWSSHTQVSQLQFTSESECFWELPPPPALYSKDLVVWMWKHKMS